MDDDTPNTQAAPVPTVVITVPTRWTDLGGGCAGLPVTRQEMVAIDFYQEPAL